MAIVMSMTWPGISPAQYDALRTTVHWEGDPPAVQAMGITTQPEVSIRPAHAVWALGYTPRLT